MRRLLAVVALVFPLVGSAQLQVGAAKTDITPSTPIRLTGYAARKTESEGVEHRLFARALAIGTGKDDAAVLVTLDTMAIPRELVDAVAARVKEKAGLPRERLAICATHTHAAPMIAGAAPNIFGQAVPDDQRERVERYTAELTDKLEQVSLAAIADLKPGTLSVARGSVGFAANRRKPPAPGVAGPVDRELPVLVATGADGALRAVVANYACHCTTGGADINKVHGDWAGFASENLEAANAGAVALVTIGCGADANPAPRGTLALARQHGAGLAAEVSRLAKQAAADRKTLKHAPVAQLKVIDLPYDTLPTKAELEKIAERKDPTGYNARVQLERLARDGKLPQSLPYTVQTWRFGDDLGMVFLAGEVVVDYALRLKHDFEPSKLWVTAYANDVPCYIPSRRILAEGGYEAEGAMVYYARPTKLAPAVENDIVRAVHEMLPTTFRTEKSLKEFPPAKSPEASRQSIQVDGPFDVELVAAEPLVRSPVAIDWDLRGRMWVLEMVDYPSGLHDNNTPGGRVVILESTKNDGRYDKSTVFMDGLPYPQGLLCWRGGVLVCAAPDILYASDDNHDDKPDSVKRLFSGFSPENQQWEVNGLAWGLDNWVYGASSIRNDPITIGDNAAPIDLGSRDFRMNPDTLAFEPAAGRTQFCRVRDDWGNWFGNDNSNPLFHYPLEERYVRRNPHATYPNPRVSVAAADKDATRLFPVSPLLERFNNPQSANRVTSACGPGIDRDELLFAAGQAAHAFFCEPVHNLVRHLALTPTGATFTAHRSPSGEKEFLASTDNWFRPVQARTGPDGALYVVDMYRFVIEHPRWITPERLKTLDTRAGFDKGRIYRVVPRGKAPRPIGDLSGLTTTQLAERIDNPNGVVRDLVHRELVHRNDQNPAPVLEQLAKGANNPAVRVQAACALDGLGALRAEAVLDQLADADPRVRRNAARLAERFAADERIVRQLLKLAGDADAGLRFHVALALGAVDDPRATTALAQIATAAADDAWTRAAVLTAAGRRPVDLLEALATINDRANWQAQLVRIVGETGDARAIDRALSVVVPDTSGPPTARQLAAVAGLLDAVERRGVTPDEGARGRLGWLTQRAREILSNPGANTPEQVAALQLLCRAPGRDDDVRLARAALDPKHDPAVQSAAVAALSRSRDSAAAAALVDAIPVASPAPRAKILEALTARPSGAAALLAAIESGTVAPTDLPAAARDKLLATPDPATRARATKALAVVRPPARADAIKTFAPALKLPGDRTRGKTLFDKTCLPCHNFNGAPAVGPDLAALTDKSAPFLLASILDPNAAVDGRYVAYRLDTTDGDTHIGLVASESASAVTLAQPSGLTEVVPRAQIKSLTSSRLSLMPEGLEQGLTPQDLADLIAYVQAPGR